MRARPENGLGTPGELKIKNYNFQRRSIKAEDSSGSGLRRFRCGLSHLLRVPLVDDARAKPDIMAPHTARVIWHVVELEEADTYRIARTYVHATAKSECKSTVDAAWDEDIPVAK